ncbi:MAG: protoporphyrinogen oxidase [Elusimicrobia bacterium]|nr:protoporphyrinogen oxidase [Elusimicrobiota bacterium]
MTAPSPKQLGRPPRVAILGAGISGLSAAYELSLGAQRQGRRLELMVLEASTRIGGKVTTESREGIIVEGGPDSFIGAKPEALELIDELGLSQEVIGTNPCRRPIQVLSGGRLESLPEFGLAPSSPWPWLASPLLSWRGKLRMCLEPLVPGEQGHQDESIASFFRRRLGAEALDKIFAPMFGGIYAGDCEKLSLQSTFPQLREMERKGGLLRSMQSAKRAPRPRSGFMTLRGGLTRLIEALARALPGGVVRAGAKVESVARRGGSWELGVNGELFKVDAVISALPAPAVSALLSDVDFELSCALREIPFVSTATVSLALERAQFKRPLQGFGFLIPRAEGRRIIGATFSSSKFPGRAPENTALIRCFVGGAGQEELAEAPDEEILRSVSAELKDILRMDSFKPALSRVFRWPKANPQYLVGHALKLKRIASCLQGHPGLWLTGCSFEGVSLPDCIRSGRRAGVQAFQWVCGRRHAGS